MAKSHSLRWTLERHSAAKHAMLRGYLNAWIPMRARNNERIALIDGFAGPGRYEGGEPGSPLIMLSAYAGRQDVGELRAIADYTFIESHKGRADALREEIEKLDLPAKVDWRVLHGPYEERMEETLTRLEALGTHPTFAFIDPFGYEQNKLELTSRIVGLGRCEVLVFVPLPYVARFIEQADSKQALINLYGGDAWEKALGHEFETRKQMLHDVFKERLEGLTPYVRSFEIVPIKANTGYHLFFGTSRPEGVRRIKDAMWSLDPVAGARFRDSTVSDHPVLFEAEPDLTPLKLLVRERFGTEIFTIEEASEFVLLGTGFRDNAHLKRPVLGAAEKGGELQVVTSQRKKNQPGAYPPGTRLRFLS